MRIDKNVKPLKEWPGEPLKSWIRIAENDGSTFGYVPDETTAENIIEALELRKVAIEDCKSHCNNLAETGYKGRHAHVPNCYAYNYLRK